jgi:hypothetical protein
LSWLYRPTFLTAAVFVIAFQVLGDLEGRLFLLLFIEGGVIEVRHDLKLEIFLTNRAVL